MSVDERPDRLPEAEACKAISDSVPTPMRVVVVASTGMIRAEIAGAFDEDFEVIAAADARTAEEAVDRPVHALVVVADDLVNCAPDLLVQRVRVACQSDFRLPVLWLCAHGEEDLLGACQAGVDDIGRWPADPDLFRARVRSLVRVSALEASMTRMAASGIARLGDLRLALATSAHLINNSVAGVSGRAQLAALTGGSDDSGLVPVCLGETRKVSLVLNALHVLSEAVGLDAASDGDDDEGAHGDREAESLDEPVLACSGHPSR